MLAISRELNPECEHIEGDMRALRLGRTFDRVFVHDAICYMTSLEELAQAIETAFVHCKPGGRLVVAPDCVKETFAPNTDCGGNDGPERSLRYLEWTWDPDPSDTLYTVDYTYVLRDAAGAVQVEQDRHIEGLFSRNEWLRVLEVCGFQARCEPFRLSDVDHPLELFIGTKLET
jgi:SAM-dependent methyltransferase